MVKRRVSITELARFCHRGGSIDSRFGPSPSGVEGIAGHQRLYAQRPPSYQREFPVEYDTQCGEVTLQLRGRADGYDADNALLEEIKTCRVAPGSIPEAISTLHMSQAMLYAAVIAEQSGLPSMHVRLTWFNIDSEEELQRTQDCSAAQLRTFLHTSLTRFGNWMSAVEEQRNRRNLSLATLPFPLGEFRTGQREIAELTYKCVDQAGELLLEAPTGIGKTAAVLYPALKALANDKHDKLVFVTAKNIGRLAAEEALTQCRERGMHGSALTLTARERVCFSPGKACQAQDCPYADGYYDKLPAALETALEAPALRREEIEAIARQFEVCPYELALDMLPWVDIVIADLHYVYSLYALLGSAMASDGMRWSILLDEAHNLPDRARSMYSASLAKSALLLAKRGAPAAVAKRLERVNRQFLQLSKQDWQEPDFHSAATPPESLQRTLQDFSAAVSAALGQEPTFLRRSPALRDFFFDALHFLRVAEEWGPEFRLQLTRGAGKQSLRVTLTCLDPARLLTPRQANAHSVTAFSATLSPLDWSRHALGLPTTTVCHRAASPFSAEQLRVSINSSVDTRYHNRAASLPALASALQHWLANVTGNCIIYFPSYRYMEDCLAQLPAALHGRRLWQQQSRQTDGERDDLLRSLREHQNIAAFCILGGILGEGIDLPGDLLASVVIVGVGMPQVNRHTRELQSWHEERSGAGFAYTFQYPGMQKVAQALGRVVRTTRDTGSALLIDSRYAENVYRHLLPPWWEYRQLP